VNGGWNWPLRGITRSGKKVITIDIKEHYWQTNQQSVLLPEESAQGIKQGFVKWKICGASIKKNFSFS